MSATLTVDEQILHYLGSLPEGYAHSLDIAKKLFGPSALPHFVHPILDRLLTERKLFQSRQAAKKEGPTWFLPHAYPESEASAFTNSVPTSDGTYKASSGVPGGMSKKERAALVHKFPHMEAVWMDCTSPENSTRKRTAAEIGRSIFKKATAAKVLNPTLYSMETQKLLQRDISLSSAPQWCPTPNSYNLPPSAFPWFSGVEQVIQSRPSDVPSPSAKASGKASAEPVDDQESDSLDEDESSDSDVSV
jgi:hypothetical protein